MSTSSGPKAIVKPIFREYIGVKRYPDNLTDFPGVVINPKIQEFHFILGFAKENYDKHGKGTGQFIPTWNARYFNAENIGTLKQNHQNVKVLISIGGVGTACPFHPARTRDEWTDAAIGSLQQIINDYKVNNRYLIDGIDINYDVIRSNDFAHCIGQVINDLMSDERIKVVSIAPSDEVQTYYRRLYEDHECNIHWVNYKFYNQPERMTTADMFKNLFLELSNVYHDKLLAGFSTDPDVHGVTRDVFIQGCTDLLNSKLLPGIFVWNANDSAAVYSIEELAQSLLVRYA